MNAAILGKKIGMTRVFTEDGTSVPVTVVQAGPCPILQVKTKETDGYEAVQLGFDSARPARSTRPQIGHTRKASAVPQKFVREIRLIDATDKKAGETVTVEIFEQMGVKYVDVVGTSIGKGFQGVMKRHNFGGQPGSHGTERKHRSAGGIGSSGNRGHGRCIKKGKRMAGHMGHERCTVRNQHLVGIDKDRNLLLIQGAVPGPKNGYLIVSKAKTKG
ncbi:MAG: 50S ribosomal protein L3 [Planctomycetota bacterium]|nr:MAG: 50S ribosomal protein L3 [Planctomycetota bacterium]